MSYNRLVSTEILSGQLNNPQWVVIDCRFKLTKTEQKEHEFISNEVINKVILPVINKYDINYEENFIINGTGRFVLGGPEADTGLTGRKIIVDTYGGYARHGGGAFSGKDPSKVDRSASYMARYVAKNVVAANLAERCEVQLAYSIGVAEPVSVSINTFDTSRISDNELIDGIKKVFDFTPAKIISALDLKTPIYSKIAAYGHFGRTDVPWEKTDKVVELKQQFDLELSIG